MVVSEEEDRKKVGIMRLVFLGPPGAGKGTQAKVISERFGIPHISTGEILRSAIKSNSSLGKEAKAYVERGELVPDIVVSKIVFERLLQSDAKEGFILDGFPRTKRQAEDLDNELNSLGLKLDYVIYFETSEQVSISRLSGRRVCRDCGTNFHIVNMRPKKDGICDICGGELYQRDDDKEETVRKRLRVYEAQTSELIQYYNQKGLLKTVVGDMNVDEVFRVLCELFEQNKVA